MPLAKLATAEGFELRSKATDTQHLKVAPRIKNQSVDYMSAKVKYFYSISYNLNA